MAIKSLEELQADLCAQYEAVKAEEMDLKLSGELSNIAGKFLKAVALQYLRDGYLSKGPKAVPPRLADAA